MKRYKNIKEKRHSVGWVIGTIALVIVLAILIFACIFAIYVRTQLLSQSNLSMDMFELNQTSVVYYQDEDGKYQELQQLYSTENRIWADYDEIPQDLINAAIAIEDKRFKKHHGVDWKRTLSASLNMFMGGRSTYGASTITQQLIKNLTGEEEVTVRRKILEISRAIQFEKRYSKDEVMEWYLNTIYLGEGCYGAKSAAQVYFGKELSDLTLAECASLIGITNNPSLYDPYLRPENNKERQETILYEMLDQGFIEQEAYDAAVAQELVLENNSGEDETAGIATQYYSYFVDQVIRDVVRDLSDKLGYDEKAVNQMVLSGGYQIYSTIDLDVQAAVDEVYTDLANVPNTTSSQQLQSAIVIIDNETGDVVGMAGGVGEKEGSLTLNRATQSLLSPGSSIKPVTVYGPALDAGIITPISAVDDSPYMVIDGRAWPQNQNRYYSGLLPVREALSRSLNTASVRILSELTPEYSFHFAKDQMGLATLVERREVGGQVYSDVNLSPLALGSLTDGVTVKALATAYAAYANQGQYREARTYTQVLDSKGNVILDNTQDTNEAVSAKAAWYMTSMLQYAVDSGTGSPARLDNMPVAGKTGTTSSDHDRWFVGYTPYYCAAVWCGYDEPEEVILSGSGTNPAVVMWRQVMSRVHQNLETASFDRPGDLVTVSYCRDSGMLATEWCEKDVRGSRVTSGQVASSDAPSGYCTVHQPVEICNESGMIANEFCSQTGAGTTQVGMLDLSRFYSVSGVSVADQQYVHSSEPVPAGMYEAVSSEGGQGICTVHTAASIAPPEEEEEANGAGNVLGAEDEEEQTDTEAETGE